MIKAVIFDCFGVLAQDGWLPFRKKYFTSKQTKFADATDLNRQTNAGLITYKDFLQKMGEAAGISAEQARKEIEDNPANRQLLEFIRNELKPLCKIGMLSNASAYFLDEFFTTEQIALFDEIVLSYQVGATKPDPATYQTTANRLGVLPEECIFIDDQLAYVDAAQRLGMKGILFEDTDETIAKIEEIIHA